MGKAFELPRLISEEVNKRFEFMEKCRNELDKRYRECDSKGHQAVEENYCNYCFRHLEYKAPRTDAILKEREKLHPYNKPLDAPVMAEERRREIELKKFMDKTEGLQKIIKKLSKD